MTPFAPPLDPAWLRRLQAQLNDAPERPRDPLELARNGRPGDAARIGSIEPALAQRLARAGLLSHRAAGDAWCLGSDAALADVAHWLHANGRAGAWRGELLEVVDAADRPIAAIERAAVRPLGIATRAVHLVATDAGGRVWVQLRAATKDTDPGRWDTTMGGLIAAGESVAQTLARETWEEAGLRVAELDALSSLGRFTVRRPTRKGYMVEHIEMFEAVLAGGGTPVNQDGEVERFECWEPSMLVERLHDGAFTSEAAIVLATWLAHRATPRFTGI